MRAISYWMTSGFLLYSPLNQGLKHQFLLRSESYRRVFTLQSIKSRIETRADLMGELER